MSASCKQILTTTEAGERLGVRRAQVVNMCERGALVGAFVTLGGHWRIPEAAVETYKSRTRPVRRLRAAG